MSNMLEGPEVFGYRVQDLGELLVGVIFASEYDRDFFVVGTSSFCQTFDSMFVLVLFISQI